jgi:hypothetical protein
MRVFYCVVLTGGLLLVGLDVHQSRQQREALPGSGGMTVALAEDGTGFPPNFPPPPPPPLR